MKIGVIQASSQKEKNAMLFQCVQKAIAKNGRDDEVINFGVFEDEETVCSYVETALGISLLLSSQAVDFIVTGCSSGERQWRSPAAGIRPSRTRSSLRITAATSI